MEKKDRVGEEKGEHVEGSLDLTGDRNVSTRVKEP